MAICAIFQLGILQTGTGVLAAADAEQTLAIGFKLYRGRMVLVKGSFLGAPNLTFVIDTGANQTIVDRTTAERLGLECLEKTYEVNAFNGSTRSCRIIVRGFRLGPIYTSLVAFRANLLRWGGPRVDAIIGLDLLRRQDFSIDYSAKEVYFGPERLSGESLLTPTNGLMKVNIEVEGSPLEVIVDTGASGLILFQDRVRGRLPRRPVRGLRVSRNLSGRARLTEVRFASVRIGPEELTKVTGFLMSEPARGFGPEVDGVVSPVALGFHRVHFDFRRGIVSWEMLPIGRDSLPSETAPGRPDKVRRDAKTQSLLSDCLTETGWEWRLMPETHLGFLEQSRTIARVCHP